MPLLKVVGLKASHQPSYERENDEQQPPNDVGEYPAFVVNHSTASMKEASQISPQFGHHVPLSHSIGKAHPPQNAITSAVTRSRLHVIKGHVEALKPLARVVSNRARVASVPLWE